MPLRTSPGYTGLRQLIYIPLITAVTAVLGYVIIPLPFSPVPITGQTLGVMLAGSLLGRRGGAISMLLLLLLGVVGIPVFAGGSAGLGILAGPRGGYLLSFPVAAFVIGAILERLPRPRFWSYLLLNALGGIIIVYAAGVPRLASVTGIPLAGALLTGALPFIPGDILKVITASLLAERLTALGITIPDRHSPSAMPAAADNASRDLPR